MTGREMRTTETGRFKSTEIAVPEDGQTVSLTLFHLPEETKWKLKQLAASFHLSESETAVICIEQYHESIAMMTEERLEDEIPFIRTKYEGKGRIFIETGRKAEQK